MVGHLSASKWGDYVLFVAPFGIKVLRLVTAQLPKKIVAHRTGARSNFAMTTAFLEARMRYGPGPGTCPRAGLESPLHARAGIAQARLLCRCQQKYRN
jgi:hypothetical protein